MIQKILVANRGEIARRIIRTAKTLGIRTVSIYSDADLHAAHRYDADESYPVGAAPSGLSYLRQEGIIEIAKLSGCDAIHPGYGFLSENASFAEKVLSAGLTFIGPSVDNIRLMGDKLAAKNLAREHGIPLLAGTDEAITDLSVAIELAADIGYPLLLKAAGGGGGKGMRIVRAADELEDYFQLASSEARQSFGDARVFIERYLEAPKHIEIQIMADRHGNVVHIFERDCSIQRRHQKVIEESPAPLMTPELRGKMTDAAVLLARACDYQGAGTVEFLVDKDEQFYFLEMNTRLQVEHPVTESISGLDLVAWQILVANGQVLPLKQEQICLHGHSIQLRIYAEDILDDFSPSLGRINHYKEPEGDHIRIDGAVLQNMQVSLYYDPLLAKLIVWGKDRTDAINLLINAIRKYEILGVETTLPLGLYVANHPSFIDGTYNTHFLQQNFTKSGWLATVSENAKVAGILAAKLRQLKLSTPQINRRITDSWLTRLKD